MLNVSRQGVTAYDAQNQQHAADDDMRRCQRRIHKFGEIIVIGYKYRRDRADYKPDNRPVSRPGELAQKIFHQLCYTEKSYDYADCKYKKHEYCVSEIVFQKRNGFKNFVVISENQQQHRAAYARNNKRAACNSTYQNKQEISVNRHIFA